MNVLVNLNLNGSEIQNVLLQNLASNPTPEGAGHVYYNTTSNVIRYYTGSAWIDLAASTGGGTVDDIIPGAGITVTVSGNNYTVSHTDTSSVANLDTANAQVIDEITFDTFGHVTGITTRNLTLANLGYTGAANADNYNSWTASADTGSTAVTSGANILFDGDTGIVTSAAANLVRFSVDNTVVRTVGNQTIAVGKTFTDDVVINANLTITGNTTTTISENVLIEDALLTLNSNKTTGTPTEDAGLVIRRGASNSALAIWQESTDKFVFATSATETGSTSGAVTVTALAPVQMANLEAGEIIATAPDGGTATHFVTRNNTTGRFEKRTAAQTRTDIGAGTGNGTVTSVAVTTSNGISGSGTITTTGTIALSGVDASTTVKGVSELATLVETREMTDAVRTVTPSGLKGLRHSASIGNGSATSITVTHNLGSLDVIVQLYVNATGETVYADVVRTSVNAVRCDFRTAPATNALRVLIVKI
jgi:hypothetical protein